MMIKEEHPLSQLVLNASGSLAEPVYSTNLQTCPTCLEQLMVNEESRLIHPGPETSNTCFPSFSVVVTQAIISMLREGEKIYVNPVRHRGRMLAPSVIFAPKTNTFKPFFNAQCQPVGASWKSEKGYKLGLFYLNDRGSIVSKDEFDYIAVIDPGVLMKQFDAIWENTSELTALEILREILRFRNNASIWIKWLNKNDLEKRAGNTDAFYFNALEDSRIKGVTASVTGIDGNSSGETIYRLRTCIKCRFEEYQLVRSMGVIILLDNTGNIVPSSHPNNDIISKICIAGVRDFVRQNPWVQHETLNRLNTV